MLVMKKIMEAYGFGIIQDCDGLFTTLKKKGFGVGDFFSYAKDFKNKEIEILKKDVKERETRREKIKQPKKEKPRKNIFLKPGETVLLPGVVCEKCHGEVYIEGLCRHNPLVKQGFVRRGICGNCGTEFFIR